MPRIKHTVEQIITKLRETEVVLSKGRIERLCERDVAFRVLTANQRPDHTTIARFRPYETRTLLSCLLTTMNRFM
jgi:transposase